MQNSELCDETVINHH